MLLGYGEQASFRPGEFAAYYRRVRSRLERFVADPPPTEPYPVDHCRICDFKPICDAYWDAVDHLSRVAGVYRTQIEKLAAAGITTLAQLGRAPAEPVPAGINADSWAKNREQAELQLSARETGADTFRLLQPQPEAGFALLPDPSPGDLFFDFEGNPFWDADGCSSTSGGSSTSTATSRRSTRTTTRPSGIAFETFVDLVHERLARYPDLHVYHYAAYEITALKRLMGRYGTREAELDDLLRRERLRRPLPASSATALRASRPGYGLKELEAFLDFERAGGGEGRRRLDRRSSSSGCRRATTRSSTRSTSTTTRTASRPGSCATGCSSGAPRRSRVRAVPAARAEGAEADPGGEGRRAPSCARELLDAGEELAAQLLDYHDRERKPVWWAFFDRIEMTPAELVEDAESIGRLELVGGPEPVEEVAGVHAQLPGAGAQDRPGAEHDRPGDARRSRARSSSSTARRGGSCSSAARRCRTCRCPKRSIPGGPYDTRDQEDALMRLGRSLLAGDRRYPALESILRREPFDRPIQTSDLDEMKELVLSLDGRHLVIQGPPGSGKTWTSGRLIAHLIAHGKRVGVASTSHKAIHNLLDAVEDAAAELGLDFRGLKKASAGNPESQYDERAHRERRRRGRRAPAATSPPAPPGSSREPSTTARSTTSSSTRPGRSRSPTRSRWGRRRGTSCSSATRSSSTR